MKLNMTDYSEEQQGELETLRCIYTEEELIELSDNPPTFQITATSEHEDIKLSIQVQFTFPETYPDVPPEMTVVENAGLTQEHVDSIETMLKEQAIESVGMVMVFTLVSAMQDRLGELVDEVRSEREREKERKEDEDRMKAEARFHGTPVTMETFQEWKRKFDEEQAEGSLKSKEKTTPQSQRLTGRQMFERDASLALSDAQFLVEEGGTRPGEAVEVDESLFQDLEDLELDDNIHS